RYQNKVKYWLTFNEINIMGISGYVGGALLFEDGNQDLSDIYLAVHHQFVASSLVTKFAHELKADLKVGMMLARMEAYPATRNPLDVMESIHKEHENLFFSDDQVRGKYPDYTKRFFTEYNIHV